VAGDELVDVLDEDGRVVGVATRAEMRAANLWHRTVFVVVVTPEDEVVVHRRADWKDVWPSRWDLAFGGVVAAGEDWVAAAVRELAEEAGVEVAAGALRLLGEGRFENAQVRERYRFYRVCSGGPFSFADGEVTAVERVPRADLDAWCATHELVPDSAAIIPALGDTPQG
jgi:8-oxo-dGTP pyrophosphatase MutT (NUDIX family)